MGHRLSSYTLGVAAIALFSTVFTSALAQPKERPRLKDFGSSLKRIKWNDEKKAAVEVNPNPKGRSQANDVEVIKIETSLVTSDVLVLDTKGNFVPGLSDKDFLVSEDGQPQQVSMLGSGDSPHVSRSIVLIID